MGLAHVREQKVVCTGFVQNTCIQTKILVFLSFDCTC
jgi:hypothetical protein